MHPIKPKNISPKIYTIELETTEPLCSTTSVHENQRNSNQKCENRMRKEKLGSYSIEIIEALIKYIYLKIRTETTV